MTISKEMEESLGVIVTAVKAIVQRDDGADFKKLITVTFMYYPDGAVTLDVHQHGESDLFLMMNRAKR